MANLHVMSKHLAEQREMLNNSLAAYDSKMTELGARRAQLDAEWRALVDEQNKHRDALLRHETAVSALTKYEGELHAERTKNDQRSVDLDEQEQRLKEREKIVQDRTIDHGRREGDIQARTNKLAMDEENYRIRMHRLKQIVEEYFLAPGK